MLLFLIACIVSVASWSLVKKVGYRKHPIWKTYEDFKQQFPERKNLPFVYLFAFISWAVILFFLFVVSVKTLPSNDGTPVLWLPFLMFQGWGAMTAIFELTTGVTFMLRNRMGRIYSVKDYPRRSAALQLIFFAITVALYIAWSRS